MEIKKFILSTRFSNNFQIPMEKTKAVNDSVLQYKDSLIYVWPNMTLRW